jgi:hypothetical protein
LRDDEFRERLAKAERELRAKVKGNAEIGDPWTEIDKAVASFSTYFTEYFLLEERPGWRTDLYINARELVRAAIERDKPAADRLPAYAESRLPLLEKTITDEKPILPVAGRDDDGVLAFKDAGASHGRRSAREGSARQGIS